MSDVVLQNTFDLFCDEKISTIGEERRRFYYDDDHLREYGALKLVETIDAIFLYGDPSLAN